MQQTEEILRQIPHVDKLMKNGIITGSGLYRHEAVEAVRLVLAKLREDLISGDIECVPEDDEIAEIAVEQVLKNARKNVRKVINGTGVILHSNLGRACMSGAAARAASNAAASYCTLEYDVETGSRGERTAHADRYLRDLTGCEASLIVNNNAAAMLLILTSIAQGGNVVVSRGELVEIGGGFRVPDIIEQCGCVLREAGTTNKTRLGDYSAAIDENTRALLKIHTSNFKIVGFTDSVALGELATLGKSRGIPVIEDIGSGALLDIRRYGLYGEPFAADSIKNGADIVCFSGDKLLGGPQCGIILGREKYISAMKKHPLYRALRTDKMTIAALEATLRVYADPNAAEREIPVLSMLSTNSEELRYRAEELCREIARHGGAAEVIRTKSVAGGGSVPGLELDSFAISPAGDRSADSYERELRIRDIPVIGRIEEGRLLLDLRTMFEEDFEYIAETVAGITMNSS